MNKKQRWFKISREREGSRESQRAQRDRERDTQTGMERVRQIEKEKSIDVEKGDRQRQEDGKNRHRETNTCSYNHPPNQTPQTLTEGSKTFLREESEGELQQACVLALPLLPVLLDVAAVTQLVGPVRLKLLVGKCCLRSSLKTLLTCRLYSEDL